VALLVARRTNNRKVVGSRPTKVVCITVLTGNRLGWTVRCGRPPLLLPSCRKLEFRLSALMDSDLAWVNGKSGRQSWCYADAFQRSIISGASYHFTILQYKLRRSSSNFSAGWMNVMCNSVMLHSWLVHLGLWLWCLYNVCLVSACLCMQPVFAGMVAALSLKACDRKRRVLVSIFYT